MNISDPRFSNVSVIVERYTVEYTVKNNGDSGNGMATGEGLATSLGGSVVQSQAGSNILAVLLALDPSGVMLKLSQMLKIVSRLYYINMNYGDKLDGFLFGIRNLMPAHGDIDQDSEPYKRKWRGKLSKDKIPIDPWEISRTKSLLYIVMFMLNIALVLGSEVYSSFEIINQAQDGKLKQVKVPKALFYVLFYFPKVHLMVFNTVQLDFVLYGARAALHASNLSVGRLLLNYVILLCLSVDCLLFLQSVFEAPRWAKYVRRATPLYISAPKDKQGEQKDHTSNNNNSSLGTDKPQPEQLIDYDRTLAEIRVNYHLIELQCGLLRLQSSAVAYPLVRVCFVLQLLRNFWFQLVVVGGQYATGVALFILISIESSGLLYTLYTWLQHKHLNGVVILLMECLQRMFLLCFVSMAFWHHTSRFDEVVPASYQTSGIFVIILACATEYIMLLIYLTTVGVRMFRKRRDVKELEKIGVVADQKHTEFIKYKPPLENISMMSVSLPKNSTKELTSTPTRKLPPRLKMKLNIVNQGAQAGLVEGRRDPRKITVKATNKLRLKNTAGLKPNKPLATETALNQLADVM